MSGELQAAARLELSYSPTAGDFREAPAARAKVSVAARRLRRLTVAGIAFAIVAGGASWLKDGRVEAPLVVMLTGFLLIQSGVPRLQARQFHRLSVARGPTGRPWTTPGSPSPPSRPPAPSPGRLRRATSRRLGCSSC